MLKNLNQQCFRVSPAHSHTTALTFRAVRAQGLVTENSLSLPSAGYQIKQNLGGVAPNLLRAINFLRPFQRAEESTTKWRESDFRVQSVEFLATRKARLRDRAKSTKQSLDCMTCGRFGRGSIMRLGLGGT
jgi:hypothetical protein